MGKIGTACCIFMAAAILSGCGSGPREILNEKTEETARTREAETEAEPALLEGEEESGFILEDEEAYYVCGSSRIVRMDKRESRSALLWENSFADGQSMGILDGKALLLQDKIYFIETAENDRLSVMNRDGTGYRVLEELKGFSPYLFFVDGILYTQYYDSEAGGWTVSAYWIFEEGSLEKIQDVKKDTPYRYKPEGYDEWDVRVPVSLKRYGYLLLVDEDWQLVKVDPKTGQEEKFELNGGLAQTNEKAFLSLKYDEGDVARLYLADAVSLDSRMLAEYEGTVEVLGMDSEYAYIRQDKWLEEAGRQCVYSRVDLKTGETRELFARDNQDAPLIDYFVLDVTGFRNGFIYYADCKNYKVYLARRNVREPGRAEFLGEALYDSGISRVGSLSAYHERFLSHTAPESVLAEFGYIRLVVNDSFLGAGEINRYLENEQWEAREYEKAMARELENEIGGWEEMTVPYSYGSGLPGITYFDGEYFSFCQEDSDYLGGAHDMPYRYGYTFDLRSGKRLGLEDIVENSEEEIKDTVTEYFERMMEQHPDDYWEDAVLNVRESAGYESSFYLTPEGIRFFYPPYELACFAAGFQEVTVPYGEFRMKAPFGRREL